MTVSDVLIIVFGLPTLGFVSGIFLRIGKIQGATEAHTHQIAALWNAINDLRKELSK